MQLPGLVHKIAMFPHLFNGFKNILETNEQTKEAILHLNLKKNSKLLKETDKRVHATANVKLTIN